MSLRDPKFSVSAFRPFRIFLLGALTACGANSPELTLQQAHEIALRNNPLVSVADLRVLVAREATREARAAFFPQISGNVIAVGSAGNNTRLTAVNSLSSSFIYDRNAEGVIINQLITDFGRTANLTGSAKLRALAEAENAQATREQILLAVDSAFYAAQEAQSVLRVADQTIATRQLFLDQVSALASNKIKSELDVSFANVNLEQGKLLESKARNDLQAGFARLAAILGQRDVTAYRLIDTPMPPEVSTNDYEFIEHALSSRPDLRRLRNERLAAVKFSKAERALRYPSISATGAAGVTPIGDSQLADDYAAAGVSLNLPLFTGGMYSARQKEAELRAQAVAQTLRDEENNVIRDVRIAWLNAQNAFDRLRITGHLVDTAERSYELAQARYQNQVSSMVELNQAELSKVSAEISYADTKYEYLLLRSALDYQIGELK
jgi:outer membrane protein